MERHSFAMEIKKGKKNEYRQILGEIWPDLTAFLDQEKVHNFSIWNCDSLIFGYYETDKNNEFSEEKKASIQALTSRIDHTFTWISTPGENIDVYKRQVVLPNHIHHRIVEISPRLPATLDIKSKFLLRTPQSFNVWVIGPYWENKDLNSTETEAAVITLGR